MNNTITSAVNNLGTVLNVMTDNLQSYAGKVLNEIKNTKPEIKSEVEPILGYNTGNQGFYDSLGGGPCNKYCRYTGLSPNIQWTCSDSSDLSKLTPTPLASSGRFCYAYDKKSKNPPKNGVVINGSYISTEQEIKNLDNSGNYNFTIYNNKNANGIDNFDINYVNYSDNNDNIFKEGYEQIQQKENMENMENIENFENGNNVKCVFDYKNYSNYYPDLNKAFGYDESALKQHYLTYGINETRTPCGVTQPNCPWNSANYLVANPDVAAANVDALTHYKTYGINEGRSPCPSVNPTNWIGPEKMDYPFNDIRSFSINEVADCGSQCLQDPNCKAFVTTDASDYCWLKSDLGNPNPAPNRNTYRIDRNLPSTDPRWTGPMTATNYLGNDLGLVSVNTTQECGEACAKNPKCKGFVIPNSGVGCYLKSDLVVQPNPDWNAYKMKFHYDTVDNLSLKDCENVCQNDDNCKGFSYDMSKKSCVVSQEKLNPSGLNTNNIVGNKKEHLALDGMYNIYQNNACINNSLFGNNPTVTGSMGLLTDSNGVPKIPKMPVCTSQMNNNFIFGKNYEIMTIQKDIGSNDTSSTSGSNWFGMISKTETVDTDTSWDLSDAYCLQKNPDGSVSPNTCTYADNQKWTYDPILNNIRTWDGNCLNVDTSQNNVSVKIKPCSNDVNQRFILNPVSKNLQPDYNVISTTNTVEDVVKDGGVGTIDTTTVTTDTTDIFGRIRSNQTTNTNDKTEPFAMTNTNVNNYLSSNRNSADYLYKLPYSSPYLKNINDEDELENYELLESNNSVSNYVYLICLIVLVLYLFR
jgi:hypothetical protein